MILKWYKSRPKGNADTDNILLSAFVGIFTSFCFVWPEPRCLIRVTYKAKVKGSPQEHGQLASGYTIKENVSPTSKISCL